MVQSSLKKPILLFAILAVILGATHLVTKYSYSHLVCMPIYLFGDTHKTLQQVGERYNVKFASTVDDTFIDNALRGTGFVNKAEPISDFELCRYSVILSKVFSEYPEAVIKDEIKTIKLAASLTLYGVSYGGTSDGSTLYLTSSGTGNGYSDLYIEELFHHEFNSILMRNHSFQEKRFAALNSAQFTYAQTTNAILRAITEDTKPTGSEVLYKNGFLTQYAMSTLENDVNTYAEVVFTNPSRLKKLINTYPIINDKYLLLKQFYLNIHPDFSNIFNKIK